MAMMFWDASAIIPLCVIEKYSESMRQLLADSLQLSAGIIWSGRNPREYRFVCLDKRLRDAAQKEGFTILPSELMMD
jgi:predicted nucleic acid-binding protein